VHPDDLERLKNLVRDCNEDHPTDIEFRIITSYGQVETIFGEDVFPVSSEKINVEEKILRYETTQRSRLDELEQRVSHLEERQKSWQQTELLTDTGTWFYNKVTTEMYYSDGVFRIYGILPQSLNAHPNTFHSYIHPDDQATVAEFIDKAFHEEVSLHIEFRILKNNETERHVQYTTAWALNNNGQLVQYGMLKDITNERFIEQKLDISEAESVFQKQFLRHAEGSCGFGTYEINLATRKTTYSDNLYLLYGIKPQSIPPGINLLTHNIHLDDQQMVIDTYKNVYYDHQSFDIDYRIVRKDGKTRYVRDKNRIIINERNEIVLVGVVNDLTIQKTLKEKLDKEKFKLVVHEMIQSFSERSGDTGSWFINLETGDVLWSENLYRLLGFKNMPAELTQKVILRLIHREDRHKFESAMAQAMTSEEINIEVDFRMIPAGATRYIKANITSYKNDEGNYFFCIFRNITTEVTLTMQLSEQVRFAQLLGNSVEDRVIVSDIFHSVITCNGPFLAALKRRKEEIIGANIFDVFDIENNNLTEVYNRALSGEGTQELNTTIRGIPGVIHMHIQPIRNETGEVTGILNITRDETKEHNLEQKYYNRLHFIEKLLESTVDRIIVLDKYMNYEYWNPRSEEYYGLKKEQVLGRNILEIFPGFVNDPSYKEFRRALKGETVFIPANKNIIHDQGYFETYLIPIKVHEEVTSVLWIVHDLNKEYRLAEEQRKAEQILNSINEIYFELDYNGNFQFVNKKGERYWNKSKEELLNQNIWKVLPEKMETGAYDIITTALNEKRPAQGKYFSRIANRWMFMSVSPAAEGVIVLFYDLTDVREAEQKLNETQLFLHQVVNSTLDAITVFDIETRTSVYMNDTLSAMLDYPIEELVSMGYNGRLENIIHPDDRNKIIDLNKRLETAQDDQIISVEYRLRCRNGNFKKIRNRSKVLKRNAAGQPTHIISFLQELENKEQGRQDEPVAWGTRNAE
jgi:PAS domain S-box-containing protein